MYRTLSSQDLYDYIFSMEMVDPPFCLYKSFPRCKISDSAGLVSDVFVEPGSLISVESSGDYDPIHLYRESEVIFSLGIHF